MIKSAVIEDIKKMGQIGVNYCVKCYFRIFKDVLEEIVKSTFRCIWKAENDHQKKGSVVD